ncbi:SDR family NAD(P)-dependent oxidoreductase [Blastococcus sp. Marseille-P5729]|uniref:SDR family NAD(P)-dependent oxidoreductase n=1 Tax=Blastococcus sp. Marseille-P5729 TaxID=2086582 RepID=UPI000D0FE6F1|nr:SDR family NAD(P)-dependent oxidoreductase [Blastococcus sp. Marseille-P5729]
MNGNQSPPVELPHLSRSVAGRCAIVTGSASGMGRATALLLAKEGARVVVADLGEDRVDAVVHAIHREFAEDRALGVVCDVSKPGDLKHLVARAVDWAGQLDIVVNNAGISRPNTTVQDDDEFEAAWAHTLAVNLTAQVRLARLALPHLLQSDSPRIVNIASTESIVAQRGLLAYAASKSGVVGLTKSLAVELGYHGVTVNCICPGPINTAMTEKYDPEKKAAYAKARVPLRRYGAAEEVAHMTLNLCLPSASFVTGAIIPVDGGMTVRHT